MVLTSVISSTKAEVITCLDSFTKFHSVWDEDKEKVVAVSTDENLKGATGTLGDRAFENVVPKVWNRLPLEIRQCQSLNTFKVLLKTHLFKLAFY